MSLDLFRVVTVSATGKAQSVEWELTDQAPLHQLLQEHSGGPSQQVRVVHLPAGLIMWAPQNGSHEFPGPNRVATALAASHGLSGRTYYGPVVFTGASRTTGVLPLSVGDAQILRARAQLLHELLAPRT